MDNVFLFCFVLHFSSPGGDDEEKQTKQTDQEKERKETLFTAIQKAEFPIVQGILTAKTIMSCGSNPLLVAINVRAALLNLSKNSGEMALHF